MTATVTDAPAARSDEGAPPTRAAVRGASAVRQSIAEARAGSVGSIHAGPDAARRPVTDDSAVSDDDEDIEQSGDVGRAVIEKVLGGRVVLESDD
jgi:DNA polymerase-3 subunit gamma/tau